MCGIAAIYSQEQELPNDIEFMLNKISHRGENQPNSISLGNCWLGTARLKIVDRDKGIQPMLNENSTIGVIFNGEIYNYLALKERLIAKGHSFNTNCDTEIIAHLYEEYGINFLAMLDGMFAFVLYDSIKQNLLVARDYFGVKPLYYAKNNNSWFFASEMKALVDLEIETIEELQPGNYIFKNTIGHYYHLVDEPMESISFNEAKYEVRKLIEDAVCKRVQTDLPIGVLFGGGIDSTIVLLLALKFNPDVTALIIGNDDSPDYIYANRVCEDLNIPALRRTYSIEDVYALIPKIVDVTESYEPNVVSGSVLSFLLCQMAKEHGYKLLLCGEGSDEIFAGYGDFLFKSDDEIKKGILRLLADLHRTQLQRVDRTSMNFTIEVREPLLDRKLVDFALKLPPRFKIGKNSQGKSTTKLILREAFKDILPDYIYTREKQTLMDGAGIGKVDRECGLLYSYANSTISDDEYNSWIREYPEYNLATKEDVHYFRHFSSRYLKAKFAQIRPYHAQKEIAVNESN